MIDSSVMEVKNPVMESVMGSQTPEQLEIKKIDLRTRSVLLVITIGAYGNRRSVNRSQVEVDADRDSVTASKFLLSSEELKDISKLDARTRIWLTNICLPSPLKDGVYILPNELIPVVDEELNRIKEKRAELIQKFVDVYPQLIERAQKKLRRLFNPADYLNVNEVKNSFYMDHKYISLSVPATLRDIDEALFQKEQEKSEQMWDEARENIQQLLRGTFSDLISHMADRLSSDSDGKPKIFKKNSIDNLRNFLETFKFRNVTDDTELANLVNKTKDLLDGVDAESLRNNEFLRETVSNQFGNMKSTLDTLITDKPKRKISFEEV